MVRSRVVHRGWMVGGRGVVGGWCMVGGGGVVGSRSRGVVGGFWCLSIDSLPFVGDISHIAAVVVSMVGHVLGPAVREQDGVGALNVSISIRHLASVEVSAVIVIVNSVLELVRSWRMVGGVTSHGTDGPH